jgi:catalase (peroxidase I)
MPPPQEQASGTVYVAAILAALAGTYWMTRRGKDDQEESAEIKALRADIEALLESNPKYDDGSYGPLFVRLAWHASGTFSHQDRTGGSNGATMRFAPESEDGANAGLALGRKLLEPLRAKYPNVSTADLWTLAGVVALESMSLGQIKIPWRPGRTDATSGAACPPVGRLPDASKGSSHVRDVFSRMGFSDREIVALCGAHALGRCHTNRSGYDGPWTRSPTVLTNDYYQLLLNEKWTVRKWNGPKQYEDSTGELMMLPADLSLLDDPKFKFWVEHYAKDEEAFLKDFAAAVGKLFELGVPRS